MMWKWRLSWVALGAMVLTNPVFAAASTGAAQAEATAALDAMGGAAKIQALKVVRWTGVSRRTALEQSTRPEGPWLDDFYDIVETRRFDRTALSDAGRVRGFSSPDLSSGSWTPYALTVDGNRSSRTLGSRTQSAGYSQIAATEEALALGPERALLTALQAPDLHFEAQRVFHGFAHDILCFTWRGAPVRIYVEPKSNIPAGVEIVRPRPYDLYWNSWGDIDTLVDWEFWTLEPNGLHYPRQWTTTSNGQLERTVWIDKLEFDPTSGAGSEVPNDIAAAPPKPVDDAFVVDPSRVTTVAPGVRMIAGAWNVLEVDSGDGAYVVEGPISNGYSSQIMAAVQAGGHRLLGVITTSDSWPHIGGLREYIARGVPIFVLDLNRPIVERLIAAPHRQRPDELARSGQPADIHTVSHDLDVGSGDTRMRLIPLRTVSGERQMAIFFPALKILYTSDLFSVRQDGSIFLPEFLGEMRSVVVREHLNVTTALGMHYGPVDWAKLPS